MSEPLFYTTEMYAYVFAALKLLFGPNSSHNNTTIAFNKWYHAIMHLELDFFSLLQKARMLTANLKTIINNFRGKKKVKCLKLQNKLAAWDSLCAFSAYSIFGL